MASEDCSAQQEAVQRRDGLAAVYRFLNEHKLAPGAGPAVQWGLEQVN